jgi:hypothetical protein
MSDILSRLMTDTWPAKMARSAFEALMLPGQVAGGQLATQPSQPGMWSDEDESRAQLTQRGIGNRAADLAGLVIGGGYPMAQSGALGMAGGNIMGKTPKELYHVVGPEYQQGQPLKSLYSRKGDKAYDEFAAKWPDAGDLALDHPHKIFFYEDAAKAAEHAADLGGRVVKVDPSKVSGLQFDKLEKPGYYVTRDDVPPDAFK